MSVLIKDMDMPKEGVYNAVITFDGDSISVRIPPSKKPFFSEKIFHMPTPHGRLNDADELKKNMRNYYPSIDHLCCSQHVVTKRDIDCAPTIIEAEVRE